MRLSGRVVALLAGLVATPLTGCASHQHDATARHSFADVAQWVSVFDDPERDAWQKPADVIAALQLQPGQNAADLGAGTGYFVPYLSRAVGPQGKIFAVDTEPNLITHLRQRAQREGLDNVVPVLATPDDSHLPTASIDLVLIVDTIHHIDNRVDYLGHMRACLRGGGHVVVVDWKKEAQPIGPPLEHRLARALVVEEFDAAGYTLAGEPNLLPYQYVLVFALH